MKVNIKTPCGEEVQELKYGVLYIAQPSYVNDEEHIVVRFKSDEVIILAKIGINGERNAFINCFNKLNSYIEFRRVPKGFSITLTQE